MAVDTMRVTDFAGEMNFSADDAPSVPPSTVVALAVAVLCGLFVYGQSPKAWRDHGPLPTIEAGSAAEGDRVAAWTGGADRFDERTVANLVMEGWNAGAAEEACL